MPDTYTIPIIEYLHELKYRFLYITYSIIIACCMCYYFKEEVFYILSLPLGKHFIYTNITEAFTMYIKLAIFTGIYTTFPIMLYQLWAFLVPGLYLYEKKVLRVFLFISTFLYLTAGFLGYYFFFPIVNSFFLGFQKIGGDQVFNIELQAKIHEYLLFNIKLIFAFGICFQIPIIILLIWRINRHLYSWMLNKRRFIYLLSFIIAAVLSPPDIMSQFIIAIPLLALFETSTFCIQLIQKYNTSLESIGFEPTT